MPGIRAKYIFYCTSFLFLIELTMDNFRMAGSLEEALFPNHLIPKNIWTELK